MRNTTLKTVSYWVGSLLLMYKFASDLGLYEQNSVENVTGKSVNGSYQFVLDLASLKIDLLASQITRRLEPDFTKNLNRLQQHAVGALQLERIRKLQKLTQADLIAKNANMGIALLEEMQVAERAVLEARVREDQASNDETLHRLFTSTLLDVLVIFFAGAFFFFEKKRASKFQGALSEALMQVEDVNQTLRASIAQKDSQFRTAVHDLKNPLGSILGLAELLSDQVDDAKSVLKMSEYIQKVSSSTLELVGSALGETKGVHRCGEPTNVAAILKETCSLINPVASKKSQKITLLSHDQDALVRAERDEIQSIFFNIVGNALKFSPQGTEVLVKCLIVDGAFEVQIVDQGPGFADSDFSKLFEEGLSLSAKPTGDEVSTGIGLYSVKRALNQFKGEVQIKNNSDRGACVKLRFPLAQMAA